MENLVRTIWLNSMAYLWYWLLPLIVMLFYKRYILPLYFFQRRGIPGPRPLPILGTLIGEGNSTLGDKDQVKQIKKYGKVFGIFFGTLPTYVIADTELLKLVMVKEFSHFPNRFTIPNGLTLDEGIANLHDGQWKHVRNVLTPAFSSLKMKQMFALLSDSTNILMEQLGKVADTDQDIDIWKRFGYYTMEVIMATAFGVKSEIQSGVNTTIIQRARSFFTLNPLTVFLAFSLPSLSYYLVRLDRTYYNANMYFDRIAREVIETRKRDNSSQSQPHKDFLQLILDAGMNDEKLKLTDRQIVAQSMAFLLAGYETTSNCVAYTAYLLATHPDVQDKLITEINNTCGDLEEITYDQISEMEYLEMIISESLRMYPPATLTLRKTKEECTINGYYFPRDMLILIPIYGLHYSLDYWSEPEKFDPERFSKEAKEKRDPFAFMPFGYGPRNCVGMRFALMEIKLCLASILRRYKFMPGEKTEIPLQVVSNIFQSPKNGVYLRIVSHGSY